MDESKTTPYDVADHLRTEEEMALYLAACAAEAPGDEAFMARAQADVARAVTRHTQADNRNQ